MSSVNKFVERAMGESSVEVKDKLSRRQKSLIKEVLTSLPPEKRFNQREIIAKFSENLVNCYDKPTKDGVKESQNLENQLRRMDMSTTGDMKRKLDHYIVTHAKVQG